MRQQITFCSPRHIIQKVISWLHIYHTLYSARTFQHVTAMEMLVCKFHHILNLIRPEPLIEVQHLMNQ